MDIGILIPFQHGLEPVFCNNSLVSATLQNLGVTLPPSPFNPPAFEFRRLFLFRCQLFIKNNINLLDYMNIPRSGTRPLTFQKWVLWVQICTGKFFRFTGKKSRNQDFQDSSTKNKCMFILRNSQWEESYLVERELPGEKGASPVGRELHSRKGSS